ncbi:hypothetical protein VOLCADRAFT_107798 [Volvox carteri f. nagariensis]|uniref:Uncharacterized protein n=1 Tax=Volvox carteri f. nagariensis TaxID=3068 RepID=D8UGI2_VOLCA|nr:uncharacterized protein VOLCADRAFT_107798 [Volvox carteri f. nagariensis]EFJ41178.1 hypothetical protein VOLCADRAFT_107798 [Volvox carteri f. nagariensis]|eukprot:XP_002957746.1 hypothetical protein VOLCADRAFT_107798 [Volvox carteri f. nagariensis]
MTGLDACKTNFMNASNYKEWQRFQDFTSEGQPAKRTCLHITSCHRGDYVDVITCFGTDFSIAALLSPQDQKYLACWSPDPHDPAVRLLFEAFAQAQITFSDGHFIIGIIKNSTIDCGYLCCDHAILRVGPPLHLDGEGAGRLLPCAPRTSCVSTANFMSPSQYLAPWSFDPLEPAQAKRLLLDELRTRGGTVVQEDEAKGYIAALVPYQLAPGRQDVDLLEFKFATGGGAAVAFRSEAHINTPPPPFCWTPGCISGPGNRARMEQLRNSLGWSSMETDEDKKWVQILLHD